MIRPHPKPVARPKKARKPLRRINSLRPSRGAVKPAGEAVPVGARARHAIIPRCSPMTTVAALFVDPKGCYAGLEGVDVWGEERDARKYAGPHPVVAHPPCERWGRYWSGGPSAKVRRTKGDDAGCFTAALDAVRTWGGVLEHPEASHAWRAHGLIAPPWSGGWVAAGDGVGWTCCVAQGNYGHRARKMTWLYAVSRELPSLRWGAPVGLVRLDVGFHSAEERRRAVKTGVCQRLSKAQRAASPPAFRDMLLSLARGATVTLSRRGHG